MSVDGLNGPGDRVTAAIRSASRTTGAGFDYLLNTAMRESSLNPTAKAKTSSARGLYQFIESTWLAMVKEEGPKYGLGRFAAAIDRGANGEYAVRDAAARSQILKLRENPQISALMAGALAKRNSSELSGTLGRAPTDGELYLAHFLGANGAKRLIELQRKNPKAQASAAFPEAARANKSIFQRADGKPRNAAEVFAALTQGQGTPPLYPMPARPATAVAELRPTLSADPVSAPARPAVPQKLAYDHAVLPAYSAFAAEEGPALQSLFRDGPAPQGPISPMVREIWGSFDAGTRGLAAVAPEKAAPGAIGEPMDLLGHLKPGILHRGRRSTLGS
ncbi:MAG: lytic transglycosylase domain-containing protein [Bradyrhizobiaceae bacterium]|nr:lytic transglycosylase domain-containing protein [Bradyrhizobiaceae bacterium]